MEEIRRLFNLKQTCSGIETAYNYFPNLLTTTTASTLLPPWTATHIVIEHTQFIFTVICNSCCCGSDTDLRQENWDFRLDLGQKHLFSPTAFKLHFIVWQCLHIWSLNLLCCVLLWGQIRNKKGEFSLLSFLDSWYCPFLDKFDWIPLGLCVYKEQRVTESPPLDCYTCWLLWSLLIWLAVVT